MTDNEIIKALKCCKSSVASCEECPMHVEGVICHGYELNRKALDLIKRQRAEIDRLKDEASKARRKALLEAKSKFAGHSDYHGDTILCKLICMAEGKEVEIAKPLDKSEIKSETIKEFAERLKEKAYIFENGFEANEDRMVKVVTLKDIDNLLKKNGG